MSITFNADEIFEMAEEMERSGAKFYRSAASKASSQKIKQLLLDMAAMEDGHLETFKKMRNSLGEQEKEVLTFDPDNEAAMYLQTLADSNGTEGKVSQTIELTGQETTREIFEIAVNSEKDAVVFYSSLRNCVSVKAGRDKVDDIIKEEVGHIAVLNQHLAALE